MNLSRLCHQCVSRLLRVDVDVDGNPLPAPNNSQVPSWISGTRLTQLADWVLRSDGADEHIVEGTKGEWAWWSEIITGQENGCGRLEK